NPGDMVTVFTPDHTHFEIAMAVVERGCHVLVAKPLVKTLAEHHALAHAATSRRVLVAMEVHKRWDPFYQDARDRVRDLGGFSFFHSYMSQPKRQLETFRAWAGRSSDISYYLNTHHVDFLVWALAGRARPLWVRAAASTGVAAQRLAINTEDVITLTVQWENLSDGTLGTAVHTATWIAPPSDVHSQQRFFYLGHEGEIHVDQAHRGYSVATDAQGYTSPNPLFMKYAPDPSGRFAGQSGYGYRSIESFVDAVTAIRAGSKTPADLAGELATVHETALQTAILEAGRRSLDDAGRAYRIAYDQEGRPVELSAE
ncbi:MAG: Gfo/Idh/MocA family oxidoreductase, partial [Armatimonadota bacterium]|nr:Gfo/Idh/MocA family oxidoreductase [Armatimonadota bacterium]